MKSPDTKETVRFSLFNAYGVWWIFSLFVKGQKKILKQDDLYVIPNDYKAHNLMKLVMSYWDDLIQGKITVVGMLYRLYGPRIGIMFLCILLSTALDLCVPLALRQVIFFVTPSYPRDSLWIDNGIALALILVSFYLASALLIQVVQCIKLELASKFGSIASGIVYKKLFQVNPASMKEMTEGKIMNLVSVDVECLSNIITHSTGLVTAPIHIIATIYLIHGLIGVSALGGAASLLVILVLQGVAFSFFPRYIQGFLSASDRRVRMFREVLNGIHIIKLRAWERLFSEKITSERKVQMWNLTWVSAVRVCVVALIQLAPVAMPTVSFLIYSAMQGAMKPEVVFPTLSLWQSLIPAVVDIPVSTSVFLIGRASYSRLSEFLVLEKESTSSDPVKEDHITEIEEHRNAIEIQKATFRWESPAESQDHFELKVDDLVIPKGSKVAIVGKVGSGKTALLSAIMNEMKLCDGELKVHGTTSLCAQQPWILTQTIQGNILFFQSLIEERLDQVLAACLLEQDLKTFPAGILTGIGERGVNLSGGQKARVALARALYSDNDVILLDDVLSALDASVGRQVFEKAVKGHLKEKTVLLVTHQLQYVSDMEHVIVMDNGTIVEQGSYTELMNKPGSWLSKLISESESESHAAEKELKHQQAVVDSEATNIIAQEDMEEGHISLSVYTFFFQKCGGWPFVFIVMLLAGLNAATDSFSSIWLTRWSSDTNPDTSLYMRVYGILGIGSFIISILFNSTFFAGTFFASKKIHESVLRGILGGSMSFFYSQPVGRILNRVGADMTHVDFLLSFVLVNAVIGVVTGCAALVMVSLVEVRMLALLGPLFILYGFTLSMYQKTNLSLRRMASVLKSPLYAHVSETLNGIPTIKAYQKCEEFEKTNIELIDDSRAPAFLLILARIWLYILMESYSILLTLGMALFGVLNQQPPELIGLALSYAIVFNRFLKIALVHITTLETDFNSVERLKYYCKEIPQEPDAIKPSDPAVEEWPKEGAISFNQIHMSYPSNPTKNALDDITFQVKPGEHIGIVGRTGSGKSSLTNALFRLNELHKGSIEIDGIDTSTLGLSTLRSRIQIIPQDPVLFTGTVRSNLDIEETMTDVDIWNALDLFGMKEYIGQLSGQLQYTMEENGRNFSLGQRQLLCLTRAILMKPKILVMDEATASVDSESDLLIQKAIKTHFNNCTVLSIAHRLNTVADYDKIVVLDTGKLLEYDSPRNLLERKGIFWGLVQATGPSNAAIITDLAFHR